MKTLKDLLEIGIAQELASQELYRNGLTVVKDDDSRSFLEELVKEEEQHEKLLYNIKETGIYNLDAVVEDESLWHKSRDSHAADDRPFDESWTIEDVLTLALKREYRAQKIFETAALATTDEELKELFTNLAQEEINHHKNIERRYKLKKGTLGDEMG